MLTNNEIKKQMHLGNIVIENRKKNALQKPNSCDIRLENALYTYKEDVIDMRKGLMYLKEVLMDKPNLLKKKYIHESGYELQPNKIYLAKTIERIETHGFIPAMFGKTNLSLLGVNVELTNGYKNNNYNGPLLLTIVVTKPTIIYPDIDIANLTFFKSLEEAEAARRINDVKSCGLYQSGMLSGAEIKRRMNKQDSDIVIEKPDLIVINPNSVNLTLNNTLGIYKEKVLDMKKENQMERKEIEPEGICLYPDEIYLGRTNEWTETNNLVPMMSGRSSLGRNGLHVHCSAGMGSIGFKGYWHLGLRPVEPIWVMPDMKCCQIYYFTADGEITNTYNGFMQNITDEKMGSQMHRILRKKD